ncbi:MAG TPA: hypothetical protein VN999_02825 [Thermoanaerobaculia bacterium]|nr:hypothetical protein [Thermoanaerobaculia bacterium]
MTPSQFHLDWGQLGELAVAIVVLALFLERALAVIFENYHFIKYLGRMGVKELIAVAVSVGACLFLGFDALSITIQRRSSSPFGEVLTGFIVAGGSKASVKLFRDIMNIKSTAYREIQQAAQQRQAEEQRWADLQFQREQQRQAEQQAQREREQARK